MDKMGGNRVLILFVLFDVLLILFSLVLVYAQENNSITSVESSNVNEVGSENIEDSADDNNVNDREIETEESNENGEDETSEDFDFEDEFSDSELESDEGITPDSNFYFVDEFFDKFSDEIKVREEKIAEIRAMIKIGNIEAAKIALEKYKEYAEALEKESDPEKKEEAQRSAAAIRNAIREIENDIPESERKEFVDDVIDREKRITSAVEISSKVKELCEQLSKIDPLEFSRICKTDEDTPKWQKRLNRDLTEEQKKEVQDFGKIMGECFRTQGKQCRCEDISIKPFANRCSIVAPLASKCDGGDESACEAMDDATEGMEDLLPDYLQDVMEDIERRYKGDQFDLHMPEECREAGAKTAKECMKVMFRLNAPEECIEALDEGRIDLSNEREARKACEEIMFKENAPEECIEAGLKDPKECGKLMFRTHAPEECIEAGLTGDNRGDEKKCRLIMESKGKGPGGEGPPSLGVRCRNIENAEERLRCYDSALEGNRNEERNYGGWPQQCEEAKAVTRESCESVMREFGEKQRQEFQERREEFRPFEERGESRVPQGCEGLSLEECRSKFEERKEEFKPPEGEGFVPPTEQPQQPVEGETTQPSTSTETTTQTNEGTTTTSGSSSSEISGTTSESSESSTSSSGTTGSVIFSDNEFFNYYYR